MAAALLLSTTFSPEPLLHLLLISKHIPCPLCCQTCNLNTPKMPSHSGPKKLSTESRREPKPSLLYNSFPLFILFLNSFPVCPSTLKRAPSLLCQDTLLQPNTTLIQKQPDATEAKEHSPSM